MRTKSTIIGLAALAVAVVVGWYAAMSVERGRPFASEEDAYQRFTLALTVTDAMERIELLTRLIRHLTPETLPGAIRAYEEDVQDVFNNDLRLLMWYWGQVEPRKMVAHTLGWSEVRAVRMAAGEAVYWILRKEGYDAARAFLDQLPEHQREPALPYLVLAYLESSSAPNLIAFIESFQGREERDRVVSVIVGHLLYLNRAEDLIHWVEALPEGPGSKNDIKAVAFRGAVNELVRRNEVPFLEKWFERVGDEGWAKGGRRAVAVNLARRQPERAIEWARTLPSDQGRDEAVDEALRSFARHDRAGALAWMRARPPAAWLDSGAARIAFEFALREPAVSIEMMLRIQDSEAFSAIRKSIEFRWRDLPEDKKKVLAARLDEHARKVEKGPAAQAG